MPRVSVLVPTYNGAKYLAETIQSVLDQTFTDFELLIVDDCSTDNSLEIARGFTDPRIKIFENSVSLGNGGSRNRLISLAQGEFCAMLDHDDLCLPDRLETEVNFLDNHLDVDLCAGGIEYIDGNGNSQNKLAFMEDFTHSQLRIQSLFFCCIMQVTIMFRRAEFVKSGVQYENGGADDMNMYSRAFNHLRFHNIGKCLVRYRIWSGQFSSTHRTKQVEHAIKALKYTYHTTLGIDLNANQVRAFSIMEDGSPCPQELTNSFSRLLIKTWNANLRFKCYDIDELYKVIIWYYKNTNYPIYGKKLGGIKKRLFKLRMNINRLLY